MRLNPGTRLGPYEILSTIGAGGMGEVYCARDTRLGRDVAIKVVSEHLVDDPRSIGRFEREARAVASLSHPNIVALYDVGTDHGFAFAVMELLDGEALERRIGADGLPWPNAVAIAASIAEALACAHERGIVHRDLKPANIFLGRDGIVKVLDFGLARNDALQTGAGTAVLAGTAQTEPGLVFGTVGYMAPEQVRGEPADSRSDIFSLGCVLYEMLAGRPPFGRGNPQEVLAAILRDVPPALQPHHAPPQVIAVVERCLEKQADRRFQSTRDLAFALRQSDKA